MPQYITNIESTLNEAMQHIPEAKKIDILVGYVYFSGLKTLMENPKTRKEFFEKPVRILVGMQIDAKMAKEYYTYTASTSTPTNNERIKQSQDELQYMLNQEEFDEKALLKLFIQKIENNTLEIRQTKNPAHAKIYIFQTCENPQTEKYHKGIVITGSSNLTYSGLGGQTEFNVVLEDSDAFDKAYDVFETLWKDSIAVLNINEVASFRQKVGLLVEPTPYEVFCKVLCEYFEYVQDKENNELLVMPSGSTSKNNYVDLSYQVDAIKDAMYKIRCHNGVIIADVVGLGKTITATCLAKNLEDYGDIDKTIIISPPHLKESWETYARDFNINFDVYSSGKLDEAVAIVNNNTTRKYLIVVDEAHRFRNNGSSSYAELYKICWGHKVALLSATPFNNTSSDIFSLLELFQDFNNATIYNNQNIRHKIITILDKQKKLRKETKIDKDAVKELSKEILELIHPVIIRRTRTDLQEYTPYREDLEQQKIELNKVRDPEIHEYTLKGNLAKLYAKTFERISPEDDDSVNVQKHFKGIRYKTFAYILDEKKKEVFQEVYGEDTTFSDDFIADASQNMSSFMRKLLVRRFESSVFAFKKSVQNIITSYENVLSWLEYNYLPVYKKGSLHIEDVMQDSDVFNTQDDSEEESIFNKELLSKFEDKGLYVIKDVNKKFQPLLIEALKEDVAILQEITNDWKDQKEDPKFDYIFSQVKELLKHNKDKKIIIFSEFADTVNYLQEKFQEKKEVKTISFTASDKADKKERILQNFDAGRTDTKNDFDILIATDTLSEGVNLHKAGIIINYDIPYNPTRVIQRIGRINRIGKKNFEELEIHNYIPRLEAQKDVTSWGISQFKMALINAILGGDTKTLSSEEDISAAFDIQAEGTKTGSEEKSWDTDYKELYYAITQNEQLYAKVKALPPRLELAVESTVEGIVEIMRTGNVLLSRYYNKNTKDISYKVETAFNVLQCLDPNIPYKDVSENIKSLKNEVRKKAPEQDNSKMVDAIRELKRNVLSFKGKLTEDNFEYIDLLAKVSHLLPKHDISILAKKKIFLPTDALVEDIQQSLSIEFLKRLENRNNTSIQDKPQLLVTEEFIKV